MHQICEHAVPVWESLAGVTVLVVVDIRQGQRRFHLAENRG